LMVNNLTVMVNN